MEVAEDVDVGRARRAAARLSAEAGFGRVEVGCISTSVTELAQNILRHAGGGRLTLSVTDETLAWFEVCAEDQGPGIADIAQALEDGFSTSGGLGSGLPGVRRLMDEFSITSTVGSGTRVVARKWARPRQGA